MFRRIKEFFGRITRRVVARDTRRRNGRQRHQLIQNMFEDCVIRTPNEDGIVNEQMQSKIGEVNVCKSSYRVRNVRQIVVKRKELFCNRG